MFQFGETAVHLVEHAEVHAQAQKTQQVHGFLGGNAVGVTENSVGTSDVVEQDVGLFLQLREPGVVLVLNDLEDHLVEAFQDLALRFPKRLLIGAIGRNRS